MADDFQRTQNNKKQRQKPGVVHTIVILVLGRERQKDAWVSLASHPKQGAPGSTRDHVSA